MILNFWRILFFNESGLPFGTAGLFNKMLNWSFKFIVKLGWWKDWFWRWFQIVLWRSAVIVINIWRHAVRVRFWMALIELIVVEHWSFLKALILRIPPDGFAILRHFLIQKVFIDRIFLLCRVTCRISRPVSVRSWLVSPFVPLDYR